MRKWFIGIAAFIGLICTIGYTSVNHSTLPPQPVAVNPVYSIPQTKTKCAVYGDSIALGTGWALGRCEVHALVGAPGNVITGWEVPNTGVLVVSIGSNNSPNLALNLQFIHDNLNGARLILILPALPGPRRIVQEFATHNNIPTVGYIAGRDGIHPQNYATVAAGIRRIVPSI